MYTPPPEIADLFEQANSYELNGDAYHAVKLLKKVIKMAPDWSLPYAHMGKIYKNRQEWKPALYYLKKTVSLDSTHQKAWWGLGIAATAMKKTGIARSVWTKFRLDGKVIAPLCVQLNYGRQFEILSIKPLDPATGHIINIPHPAADRRFMDLVLFDDEIAGYNVLDRKRVPVFKELGVFKRSAYFTFSCKIQIRRTDDLNKLEKLCIEAHLGFEVWSNASRVLAPRMQTQAPEYHAYKVPEEEGERELLVAIAAKREQEVLAVLEAWELITLCNFKELKSY